MTRQNISTGTAANDGTGDTLRTAATKINSNFTELYTHLGAGGGDSLSTFITFEDSAIVFEGATIDANEIRLTAQDASADRQIQLPNATGVITLNEATQTLVNKTINIANNTITATTTIGSTAVALGGTATSFAGISSLQTETLTNATGNLLVNSHTYITEFRGGGSTEGMIQLNCAVNSHGQIIRSAPHSVGATNTLILPGGSTIGNDSATLLSDIGTQTIRNKTIAAAQINDPKIGKALNDSSSNELISFTKTGSAVNHINITNKNTNNAPIIGAAGDDTNVSLVVQAKGTGNVGVSALKPTFSVDTISSNGAVSANHTYIIGNKGSGGTLACGLADGAAAGEYKIFTNKGSENFEITPTNFGQGSKFTLSQHDGCTCVFDGTNWYLVGNQSSVAVA